MTSLRKTLPAVVVLTAGVGAGLSVLSSLLLLGLCRFPESALADCEGVLIVLWLVGVVGLVCQGVVGLCLLRDERRSRSSGINP